MGKRKKRKSNVGTIIMIIVIVLLSLFVYLLATKGIDFNNKNAVSGLVISNGPWKNSPSWKEPELIHCISISRQMEKE